VLFRSLFCYVSVPCTEVQLITDRLRSQHRDLFESRFLIYPVKNVTLVGKEIALEHGFVAQCLFLVGLNDKSASSLLSQVERQIKETLGDENVLILFNNEQRR
jgi:hypothetical protein